MIKIINKCGIMKSNFPSVRVVFDRRGLCRKNGAAQVCTVELEVVFMGKRKWWSTGVRVSGREWDERRGCVVRREDMAELNERVTLMRNKMEDFFVQLIREDRQFEWSMVESPDFWLGKSEENGVVVVKEERSGCRIARGKSFVEWMEEWLRERVEIAAKTREAHEMFIRVVKTWGEMVLFKDVKKEKVLSFDKWMRDRKLKDGTRERYHALMKVYMNEAVVRGLIAQSPYMGVKIAKAKSEGHRYLTEDEVEKIKAFNGTEKLNRMRDIFLLQCYTGMAYVDIKGFDRKKVEKREDHYFYTSQRQKTSELFNLLLLKPAVEILERYGWKLKVCTLVNYNKYLKEIGEACGLEKRLSSHMGRHTFAVMCLNKGMRLEVLSKVMGHGRTETTQIYAKLIGKTVENAMLELEDKL